jgi:hypothetical protein
LRRLPKTKQRARQRKAHHRQYASLELGDSHSDPIPRPRHVIAYGEEKTEKLSAFGFDGVERALCPLLLILISTLTGKGDRDRRRVGGRAQPGYYPPRHQARQRLCYPGRATFRREEFEGDNVGRTFVLAKIMYGQNIGVIQTPQRLAPPA